MSKIKVSINICGNDYVVLSDEDEGYVRDVASEIDDKINKALKSNIRKSLSKAAVLVAMNYCDRSRKLKNEIDVYLQTIMKDQEEIEKLESKVKELNEELGNVKKSRHK